MKINGRLLLLAVVIGVFVRLWTPHSGPRVRPVVRTRAGNPLPTEALAAAERAIAEQRTVVSSIPAVQVTLSEDHWTPATSPIALPAGMAPGEYRVVNDAGHVARLTVERGPIVDSTAVTAPAPEFYAISIDQHRWYLIRLNQEGTLTAYESFDNGNSDDCGSETPAAVSAVLVPEPAPEEPTGFGARPFINRKFDFSGYEVSGQIEAEAPVAPVILQSARPLPPELPTLY